MKMEQITEIDVDKIKTNPEQPRKEFDKERIQELADSIKSTGLINPIQLKKNKDNSYSLICGERRLKAHKLLKLKKIKAIIKSYNSKNQELIESLIENLHRANLTSVERENFIYKLWKTGNFKSRNKLGYKLGYKPTLISEIILAKELRDRLNIDKNISTRVLIDLKRVKNTNNQKTILKNIKKNKIQKSKIREYINIFNSSAEDVKQALLRDKITPKQAENLKKITNNSQRKKIIEAHSEIKKIDRELEKPITELKEIKEKVKIVDIRNKINNFRFESLETQRQLQVTLNELKNCLKNINLMDTEQLKRFKYFKNLFEDNLDNCLELLDEINEKIEEID